MMFMVVLNWEFCSCLNTSGCASYINCGWIDCVEMDDYGDVTFV